MQMTETSVMQGDRPIIPLRAQDIQVYNIPVHAKYNIYINHVSCDYMCMLSGGRPTTAHSLLATSKA